MRDMRLNKEAKTHEQWRQMLICLIGVYSLLTAAPQCHPVEKLLKDDFY